ncbi:hypothetical protein ES703_84505 [subsurface metagenome]
MGGGGMGGVGGITGGAISLMLSLAGMVWTIIRAPVKES